MHAEKRREMGRPILQLKDQPKEPMEDSACLPTRECGFMVYMNRPAHEMLVVRRSLCALCVAWLLLHGDQASLNAKNLFRFW